MAARPDAELVRQAKAALSTVADPSLAAPMQAYMKSTMPFLGVQRRTRVTAVRPVLRALRLADYGTWVATVREIWDTADYREERYAAIQLARHPRYVAWAVDPRSLTLYDHMIVTGAWWDYVDELATKLVGPLVRANPDACSVMRQWSRDDDRWRRRCAVIHQIGAREGTDTALLTSCLLATIADHDFFLRKAIGWALRDYAKTDPEWVRAFVDDHRAQLSPLSAREATRNLRQV